MAIPDAERTRAYRERMTPGRREDDLATRRERERRVYAALSPAERAARNAAHGKQVLCAGCGEPTWKTTGPVPVCRPCRAARCARWCLGCGAGFAAPYSGSPQRFCSVGCAHAAQRVSDRPRPNPPGWTSAAGYGQEHQALRAELLAGLAEGAACPQTFPDGSTCGEPMSRADELDLGHTDDRAGYLGLVHAACNRRAAALKVNGLSGSAVSPSVRERARAELEAKAEAKAAARALRLEAAALAADVRAVRKAASLQRAGEAYALRLAGARWQVIAERLGFTDTASAYLAAARIGPLPDIPGRSGRHKQTP